MDDDNIDFYQTAEPVKQNMYLCIYQYIRICIYCHLESIAYTLLLTHCKRVNNNVKSTRSIQQRNIYPFTHTHTHPLKKDMKYFSIKPSTRIFFPFFMLLAMNNLLTECLKQKRKPCYIQSQSIRK